jgi:hypothetical protein
MSRRLCDLSPDKWLVRTHALSSTLRLQGVQVVMPRACVMLRRTTIVSGITGGRALRFQNNHISTCESSVVSSASLTSAKSSRHLVSHRSSTPSDQLHYYVTRHTSSRSATNFTSRRYSRSLRECASAPNGSILCSSIFRAQEQSNVTNRIATR